MRKYSFIALLIAFLLLLAACTTGGTEESSFPEKESEEPPASASSEEPTSDADSTETSQPEPEFPQPPVPDKESDTVLELLTSVPTTPDGFYPYQIFISEGRYMHSMYTLPGVDKEGNLYLCWPDPIDYEVYHLFRLNDRTECTLRHDEELRADSADHFTADATANDDGSFSIHGTHLASILSFLPPSERSYTFKRPSGGRLISYGNASVFLQEIPEIEAASPFYGGDDVYRAGSTLFRRAYRTGRFCTNETERGIVYQKENIYSSYDETGALVSQFLLYERSSFPTPCELPYSDGANKGIMRQYDASDLYLGDYTFERIFDHWVVYGSDGEMYLFLLYPDRCEVYRIHAGYHPETVSEASLDRGADFEDPTDKWGSPHLELTQTITKGPLVGRLQKMPDVACTDENGMIYLLYQSGSIYRLQDGAHYTFTYPDQQHQWNVPEMLCYQGVLYLLFEYSRFEGALLHTIDTRTDGAESVLFPFPVAEPENLNKTGAYLFTNQKQGALLYLWDYDVYYSVSEDRRVFYTMDGKEIPKEEELFSFSIGEVRYRVHYGGKAISMGKMGKEGFLETIDETGLIWGVENVVSLGGTGKRVQNFYSLYDADGELYGEILLEKNNSTVKIGKYTFSGVRGARIVCGAGNAMYLLLTYEDSVSLYTVTFD